jgi:hypothetical protein
MIPTRREAIAVARHAKKDLSAGRRRILRWIGVAVTTLVLATGGSIAFAYFKLSNNIAKNVIKAPPGQAPFGSAIPSWDSEVNLLILGSDARASQTTGDYGPSDGARSDLMMVLHISADVDKSSCPTDRPDQQSSGYRAILLTRCDSGLHRA